MKSLPPSFLIIFAKFVGKSLWLAMMSLLAPSEKGSYQRPASQFRHQINRNDPIYIPEVDRYCLYVGISCPWAHRTLIVRTLKGLENVIDVNIVIPSLHQGGWQMQEVSENCHSLRQLYHLCQPNYKGRCTVPVLWDKQRKTIVNNESAEIIVILNSQFNQYAQNPDLNLYPDDLKGEIDSWNEKIYHYVNNGVYRCGFAQTQEAYEEACLGLFAVLDDIEIHLEHHRYLCNDCLTLADIRLFTTLIRFDRVYYSLFKCSLRSINSYPNLSRYIKDIDNLPGVKKTYDLKVIQKDYFGNLFPLNLGGIIPL